MSFQQQFQSGLPHKMSFSVAQPVDGYTPASGAGGAGGGVGGEETPEYKYTNLWLIVLGAGAVLFAIYRLVLFIPSFTVAYVVALPPAVVIWYFFHWYSHRQSAAIGSFTRQFIFGVVGWIVVYLIGMRATITLSLSLSPSLPPSFTLALSLSFAAVFFFLS